MQQQGGKGATIIQTNTPLNVPNYSVIYFAYSRQVRSGLYSRGRRAGQAAGAGGEGCQAQNPAAGRQEKLTGVDIM